MNNTNFDSSRVVKRIKELAKEQGRSMTYLCQKIGLTSRTYFNDIEKHNRQIPTDKLEIIAGALNTTVNYLLGKEQEKKASTAAEKSNLIPLSPFVRQVTEHESKVLDAYRAQVEMQPAVDRLLGVPAEEETVTLYSAAHSKDNTPDEIITISKAEWERLKSLPFTDQDLT